MKFIFLSAFVFLATLYTQAQSVKKPEIGIASELKNDSLLYSYGYGYLVESISKLFYPKTVSEEQFAQNVAAIKKLKMNLYAANIFIPGDLKLVGPEVDERAILEHVQVVLDRCQRAGVKMIVWGSGGARRVPDGFDQDKAREQFINIAGKVAKIASKYNVVIVLENLNSTETNFINKVEEAYEIVKAVNHPNFRLCADIYHMLKEGESPDILLKTKKYLEHCDIAEKEGRRPPGTAGEDFRAYLKALRDIGYDKKIILECRWENLQDEALTAFESLQKQIDEVYR